MKIDSMQSGPSLALQLRKNAWLLGVAAAAFAVRVMWAALAVRFDPQLVKDPLYGDASGYQVLALNLLAGHGFSWDAIHQTSYRMPGYPAFVAFVYAWLGQEPGFVRLAQAVVGAALCVPVYYIGRDWIGRKLALCAALGTAAFPTLIYMTGWLYSETIYITVLWCGLALVARAITHPSRLHAIAGGVVLGIALMIRPEIVAFPLFLFVVGILARWSGARLRALLLVQICVLAVAVPWAVRNTLVHGTVVLLTTSGGSNFYAGNNATADGGSAWAFPLQQLSEVESDRELMQQAQTWIASNPVAALALLPRKAAKFMAPLERETGGAIGRLSTWVNPLYAIFLAVAFLGFARHRKNAHAVVVAVLVLWYLLVALVFYGGSRVALPVVPAFILLACAAFKRGSSVQATPKT